jgi:molecular chaperone DnaK
MTEEADRFKDEDKKKRELVEAKNGADAMIHATEKSMKELGDKVSADDKSRIEAAVAELKEAVKSDNVDTIKAKTGALAQASMKLGEALYKAQQQAGGGPDPGPSPGAGEAKKNASGDNVVDADFEEVKDDKKKSA